MLKKIILSIWLSLMIPSVCNDARDIAYSQVLPNNALQKLFADCQHYYLNAPWVLDECAKLNLPDFLGAWQLIVSILCGSDNRWFYFADTAPSYIHDAKACIWQCKMYDAWLKSTRVDPATGIMYRLNAGESSQDQSLFHYLRNELQTQPDHPFFIFYAFYIDCITCAFEEYVENIRVFEHEQELFLSYCKLAHVALAKADSLVPIIKNTRIYTHYQLSLKTLHQVMSLVEEEYGIAT